MAVNERRIAVLGAGKIGEALVSGLLSSGWRDPADVVASSRRAERVTELQERHGIVATLSNDEAVVGAALVVIAVKPQDIESLLGEIGHLVADDQTILSIAAAIPGCRATDRLATDARRGHLGVRISLPKKFVKGQQFKLVFRATDGRTKASTALMLKA